MEKRRMRRREKLQRIGAWTVVIAGELLTAALPAIVTAVILIPIANARRGYAAVGGEWLATIMVFIASYTAIHHKVCKEIFKEGKHE